MKHLLNNLSEEEKNNIREQHTGGMKLAIDNFKKLVESKSGDAKPYLVEQAQSSQNKKPGFKDSTFNGEVEYFFDGIKDEDTHFKFVNPFNSSQELFDWLKSPEVKSVADLSNLDPRFQIELHNFFSDALEAVARTGIQGGYGTPGKFRNQLAQIASGSAPGVHPDHKSYRVTGNGSPMSLVGGEENFGKIMSLLVQKAKDMI